MRVRRRLRARIESALGFTRGDHFKALPGYQVMATHFHMGLVRRARQAGGLDGKVSDLEVMKAAGIKIVAPIDGGGYRSRLSRSGRSEVVQVDSRLGRAAGAATSDRAERRRGEAARARARRAAILSRRWRLTTRPRGCSRIRTSWSCRTQKCCAAKSRGRWVDIRTFSSRIPTFWSQGRAAGPAAG